MKRDREKIINSGFDGFLVKPVERSELFRELSRFLKTAESEADRATEPGGEPQVQGMQPYGRENTAEALGRLERELMQSWDAVRQSGFFDEISGFGRRVEELGTRYGLEACAAYGRSVQQAAARFDVDEMKQLLERYPELIRQIRQASS